MSNSNNKARRASGASAFSRRLLCGASLAALIALGAPSIARAQDQDRYWDANGTNPGSGGNGTWDTSSPVWSQANSDVLGPYQTWDNAALDNAIFGITATGTTTTAGSVTLTAPITVHNMTFQTVNGWVLGGSTLTLAGTAPTLTINGDTTINSILAGTAGLTKLGSRTLTLTGANTFSGGITLGGGALRASTDASLGALSNNIAVTASSTLQINSDATARTVNIGTGATLTLMGSGVGSALLTGAGGISVGTTGPVRLTNDASTYTGSTRFNGCNGVCSTYFSSIGNLGEASSLGAPTDAISGTILFAQTSQYSDSVIYTGDGDSSNRNWTLQGSTAIIRNQGSGTLTITGNVTTNGGANYSAESADFQLLGTLSGANYSFGGLAGRTITLGGANDYTGSSSIGAITVKAPVLADAGVVSSLGAGTSAIALSSNGALSYTGAGASSNRSWVIANTSGTISNDGTGALNLSGAVALGTAATDNFTLGGSFAGTNTLSGVISGTGNIVSSGSGTWILGGANSFSGNVVVNSGTLQAGSATAFGATKSVTVNGGILDLNDFSFWTPTLNGTGGSIALGASGTLTVNGTVASSYAGTITGGGGLLKMGNGTLTLTGASSYTGATTIVGGALALDFSGVGGPASNILSSASTLNLSGGTLRAIGAAGEANSQSLSAINVMAGSNTLRADSGAGGSLSLNLGAINRSGGLVNFIVPTSGAITTSHADGLLGGWATVNSSDYAKVLGGTITAFAESDYASKDDAATWIDGDIVTDTEGAADTPFFGTVTTGRQLGGLRYTAAADSTVTIAAGQTLGIDGTIIAAPSVGNFNQTITGGSLTGGAGGGTLGVQQNGGGIFTIASTIIDNGGATGFVKGGSGAVRLAGANGYTGGTTLSGGRLEVNSLANGGVASSIGASSGASSNLVLEGGTLAYVGGTDVVSDRGFTLVNGGAGAPTIEVNTGRSVEFSGQVTSPDDAGLTKTGWGTLVLSNPNNDYVGVTTISGSGAGGASTLSVGTLANGGGASGIGAAGADSANLILDAGGRLQYTGGNVAIDRGFSLTNGGGRIDVSQATTTLTVSGAAIGTGQFIKDGDGTLILSGTNSYTGGTHLTAGTLRAGSTQAFGGNAAGTGAGAMTVDAGATLDLAGKSNFVGGLNGGGNVLLGAATLNINSSGTFTGTISGSGGIGVTRFTQVMTGCNNSYTGVTTVVSGLSTDCLANGGQVSGIGAASAAPTSLVLNGGSLNYTGASVSIDRGFATTSGQINVTNAATTLTLTGTTTGGSFTKEGAGTLVLSGTTTRNSTTQVNNGILRAGTINAFGTGGASFANAAGAVLDLNGFDTTIGFLNGGGAAGGNVTLGGATLTVGASNGNYAGAISGTGNLIKTSGGNQTLANCANSYDGITTVAGGVLGVNCLTAGGVNSSIGTSSSDAGNLVINGGTLRYLGTGDSTDRQFTLGTGGGRIDASGTGTLAFTSTAAVTLAGAGNRTLTLGGTNTGDNILAAQVTNPGTGTTSLTKTDAGTWRLTNQASNYTGVTTISGGVLSVDKLSDGGVASSIGMSSNAAANLVIGSGGTLRYTGTGDTTDRQFTLGVGTTAIESSGSGAVVFNNTGAVSYSGNGARVVSLGGTNAGDNVMGASIGNQNATVLTSLAKNDAGLWILTGDNSYTGVTNINAGTLILGNGGTTGSIVSGTVNDFGVLGFNRSDSYTYAGVIQGTGAVSQSGAGTTILTGDSSYTGGTTITAGTLQLGNGGTTGSIVGDVANNGAFVFNRSNDLTFAGVISGTGVVRQDGTGTTILSGTNSYAGGTIINAGTIQVSADANLGAASGGLTFNGATLRSTANIASSRNASLVDDGTILTDAGTSFDLSGVVSGAGGLTKAGAGTLTLTAADTYTGGTTITAGTLQIGNGGTTGSIVGNVANAGALVFNRSDEIGFAGVISGSGSVTQAGTGTTILTGANNYLGATNVNAGTLRINGDQSAATGLVTVANGATLGGSGIIGGSVLVQNGGTLAPGNSPGTLTIDSNLTLSAGSVLNFEFGEANVAGGALNDLINVGGNLVLDGTINVSVPTGGTFGAGIYRVFNYGGTLTDNGLDLGTMPGGSLVAVQTSVAGQVNLVNSAGLSLSFWDGDAGPKVNSVVDGGNGTWHLGGTDNNWTDMAGGTNAAYADGTMAIFAGAAGTVAVDNGGGAVTASGLQFATSGYLVQGDPLTLVGPSAAIRVGDGTAASAGYTATIASELTGTSALDKTDLGKLILTGTNSYAGGTTISDGTLQIGNGGTSGSIPGDVVDNGTLAFNRSNDVTFAGLVSGTGALVKQGAGVLTLTGANSYAGGTTIDAGTLRISSDANLGAATGGLTFNGGTLNTTADITSSRDVVLVGAGTIQTGATTTFTLGGTISGTGSLAKTDLGTLILTGDNSYTGGTTITSGRLQLGNGGTTGSIAGNVTNNATLIFNRSNAMTLAGAITGAGALEQAGSGTTTLTGTSGYTGQTRVNNGELLVEGSGKITGTTNFRVADVAGQSATMTVTGPDAQVVSTGNSSVGSSGTGILNIENGGRVASAAIGIGNSVNGNGTVNVRGVGSSLGTTDTAQVLVIGVAGTGALNVLDGGTVQAASSARIGALGSAQGAVTVSGAGSRFETATGLTLANTASTTGVLTVANGGAAVVGSGTLTMGPGNAALNIGGAEGAAATGAGTLTAANVVTSANGRVNFNHTDAGYTFASLISGTGKVDQNGPGTTILTGTNSYTGGTTINAGTLQISADTNLGDAAGGITFTGGTLRTTADITSARTVALAGAGTVFTDAGTTFELDGTISGVGALTKAGNGTFLLTADNSYAGGTTISGGTLQLGDGGTSGSILGNVANNGTLVFDRSDTLNLAGVISDTGAVVQAGTGTTILTGTNSYAGGTTISAGTLQLGDGGTSGSILGDVTDNATLAFNRSDDLTFANLVSGTGALVKQGSGALTLTGANSYLGTTSVDAGTLLINGDQSTATGATTVNSGAMLGGAGIIGGNVTVASGASLNPGLADATPGVLAINGNLSLAGGATLNYDFGQANTVGGALNDLITVGGNLTLGGTINVNASAGGSFGPGIYRVINYTGALTNNSLAIGTIPPGTNFYVQTSVANQVNLINTDGLALRFWDGVAGGRNDGIITGGNGIWQGTGGNDNWTLDDGSINAPFLDSAFAVFQGMSGLVTVDGTQGPINVAGMQFATGGYDIVGDAINLTGTQAIIRIGDGTAASAGYVATIGAALTGGAQLVKTDAGTLILGGTNSYTGGTAIDGGTLQISSDANLGDAAGGLSFNDGTLHTTADLAGTRAVTLNGTGTIISDAGTTATLGGAISGGGTLVKAGSGTLILGGASTYTGGTTVVGGTVQVSSDSNLGDVSGVLSLQGGTLQAGAAFTSARNILVGSPTSNSIDTQTFDVTLSGTIGDGPGNAAGDFLNKLGSGTLTLTGANTYGNRTIIAGGTLALAGVGTIGAANLVIGSGTVFDISQTDTGARVIQLNGAADGSIALGSKTLTLGFGNSFTDWTGTITDGGIGGGTGGRVVISAPGGAVRYFNATSYTGGTTVAAGSFELVGNGALYSGGAVAVNGGALFNITGLTGAGTTIGDLSGSGAVALGDKSLALGTGNSTTFSGVIAGNDGSIVKNGTGTFTLSGANSYTGTTTVKAGTLLVNGNQSAATGLTSVLNSATLGGSGTLGGNVTIADGGTLAPGNGRGTLTVNGNLALAAGSTLNFEFGQANTVGGALNDLVNVGGNLALDGTLNVSVSTGGSFGAGIYRVFNYDGALTDNGLTLGTLPAGNVVTVQTSVAGQVNLVNSGDLTLNFWDGDAGPKFNASVDGGNGIWQAIAGGDNWTDADGVVNAAYANGSFAVFMGAPGTVAVDNGAGTVSASGMQFATSGYLIQGDPLTLVGASADIRVGDGTTTGAGYVATIASVLTGTAALNKTDLGTLILTGTNGYTGGTTVSGGTLQLGNGGATGMIQGDVVDNGTLAFNRSDDVAFASLIAGTGALNQNGPGALTLTGANSYAGPTIVNAGTLFVNGDQSAAKGLTTVNGGATLGGIGMIGGNVTVADGGVLNPGGIDGLPGTLTIKGGLSLAAGSTINVAFGQAGTVGGPLNDLVDVGGNLTLDGMLNVGVPTGGAFDPGIYRVFNYGGTLTDNGLALGTLPAGNAVTVQTSVAGQVNLVNSGNLTLNFWDGDAGPKFNATVDGGNGIWHVAATGDNWTDANGAVNAAYANGAFAVFAGQPGTVTIDNSQGDVSAAGLQFAVDGYTIQGDTLALVGPQSTIRVGDGTAAGSAYTATINAALTGATQLVKTDAGTLKLGGINSYTGGTAINGGTIAVSADANLGDAAGGISVDGGTLKTTASFTSNRDFTLAGDGTILTGQDTTFTLGGILSGPGILTKDGAGTLAVTGDNSGYVAETRVALGTLAVDGALGGNVDVTAAARLEGVGRVGGISNGGVVAPGRGGFGTLTVTGNYVGNGGTLEIETALGDDASPTDRLVVNGATSGTTGVTIINRNGLGAQTVEGIKIIDIAGASNGTFTLNGDYQFQGAPAVVAGAYAYRLYKNGVTDPNDGDWYLRSALTNPTTTPIDPDQPVVPPPPLYQPGVPVYEGYAQTLLALTGLPTLQERVGNRSWAGTPTQAGTGIWGRMEGARQRPQPVFSTSHTDKNIDSWQMQIGVDHAFAQRSDGAALIGGLTAQYGKANTSVTSLFGNGAIGAKGYGVGATLTWYGPDGFYADGQAQVSWFTSDLKSNVLGTLASGNDGMGEVFSLEVGKRAPIGGKLSVTPQIQMAYAHVSFDRFTDPMGAVVSADQGRSLKTRWGLSIDHQNSWSTGSGGNRSSHAYAIVNLNYEWLPDSGVKVSGTPIVNRERALWGELGLGGSYSWNDRITLYAQAAADTAVADFGNGYSVKGTAGIRIRF